MARLLLLGLISVLTGGCSEGGRQQMIVDAIKGIDTTRLRAHVDALTRAGPRSLNDRRATEQAVHYIKSVLAESGYQAYEEVVPERSRARNDGTAFVNIIAERRGSRTAWRILELGAHYDTVDASPGADDNASGVAAVLETARALAAVETARTLRFCFFALEEHGRDGSYFHVEQVHDRGEALDGAIVLEMVGYATEGSDTQATPARIPLLFSPPTTGNFIAVVGNFRSGGLGNRFERAAKDYVPALPYFSANRVGGLFRDALRSDHKPYWDEGYRAIMLTDTANFRNPHYHRASDTPDTLNFTFLRRVTQAVAATLLSWSR